MSAEFFETTGIDLADLLIWTKIIACEKQDIELDVYVSANICEDMKQLDISGGEIKRLLDDLLCKAMHAVSGLRNRMILLLIARDESDCIVLKIYDSGIPFPPYVLKQILAYSGTPERVGDGLTDLMNTLCRVHASLEIDMGLDPTDIYTKGIYISFDGKGSVRVTNEISIRGEVTDEV